MNRGSSARKATRPPLRSQMRETARAAILDAAEELIAANGIQQTSLAQIAEQAGVAVGTIYNYFTDRDDLIKALFEQRRSTLRPLLRAAGTSSVGSFDVRLRAFIRDACAALQAHRRYVKIALETEHARLHASSTTPNDLLVAATTIVDAGVAEKTIPVAYRDTLPLLIIGALKTVLLRRLADDAPFEDEAETISTILLDGCRSRTR